MLIGVFTATGTCNEANFGKGDAKYCFFGKQILDKSPGFINNIIVHEFIHSLEIYNSKTNKFCIKYRNVNEAMTEYLTRKSTIFLEKNIIQSRGDNKNLEDKIDLNILENLKGLSKLRTSKISDVEQ